MIKKSIIAKNILFNLGGYFILTGVAFFLSPFVVHKLGNSGFGLWTLVGSLAGYFNLMDIGIRNSIGRFVARYVALDDNEGVNKSINSAFFFLSIVGLIGIIITIFLAFHVNNFFQIPIEYQAVSKLLILIVGTTICVGLPLSCFESILFAFERYDLINLVNISTTLLRSFLIIIFLNFGFGILSLAFITLGVGLLDYLIRAKIAFRLFPAAKFNFKLGDKKFLKELFFYGGYVSILAISTKIIFYTDSLVIGKFLTIGAITFFAIASRLIRYGGEFITAIVRVFCPIAIKLDAKNDFNKLGRLLIKGTKLTLLFSLPICLLLMILGGQFIGLWMGKGYMSASWPILIVLTLPQLFAMTQRISSIIIMGMAKHKFLAYLSMIEAIANLILSIILVRKIGLIGVAWGTAIPSLINYIIFVPSYVCKLLGIPLGTYLKKVFIRPLLSAFPLVVLSLIFMHNVKHPTWIFFFYEVLLCCGAFYIPAYFICLDYEQREKVIIKVKSIFKRELIKI